MKEGKKGVAAGVGGGDGGAAIATTESSLESPKRALRGTVRQTGGTGRERRRRRSPPCRLRGRGRLGAALAMAGQGGGSPELADTALEATNHQIEGTEREREEQGDLA
jgi:hypothetical protein